MRIAIAGGTGTLGRHIVGEVHRRGDTAVVLSRATGVDVLAGRGIEEALAGADAVIDALNVTSLSAAESEQFFTAATGALSAAAVHAGIRHVVVPSIVGIDSIPHGYYAGKLAQERAAAASGAPWSVLRLTQFHEFAEQMLARAKVGPLHLAPRARIQPIAAREAAAHLVDLAVGAPQGRVADLAGPREERLDEMVKALAARSGARGPILSVSLPGRQMAGMRAGLALPGPEARRGTQTFAQWLDERVAPQAGTRTVGPATSPRA